MKKYFLLMAVALVSWSMAGCSDKDDVADDETGKALDLSEVAIEKISESGCKGHAKEDVAATRSTSDEGERIEYVAVRDRYLRITHYNSMLNCAGHNIVTTLSAKDGVIEVSENKDTEPEANCSCAVAIIPVVGNVATAGKVAAHVFQNLSKAELNAAKRLFLSEHFGITSKKFANSSTGVMGTWNNPNNFFKAGWSNLNKNGGGMQFRIGVGHDHYSPNKARLHFDIPGTFVPNEFSNPSILLKKALK